MADDSTQRFILQTQEEIRAARRAVAEVAARAESANERLALRLTDAERAVRATPAPAAKQTIPQGWRFVPTRNENNLIVEIVAIPMIAPEAGK